MLAMPATTRPCHRVRFAAAVLLAVTTTGLTVPGVAVTPLNVRLAAASRNDLVDRLQAVELPAVAHNSILLGLAGVLGSGNEPLRYVYSPPAAHLPHVTAASTVDANGCRAVVLNGTYPQSDNANVLVEGTYCLAQGQEWHATAQVVTRLRR